MKGYFNGAVRIINKNEGKVRSFNGDGMLAIFVGDTRSNKQLKLRCRSSDMCFRFCN